MNRSLLAPLVFVALMAPRTVLAADHDEATRAEAQRLSAVAQSLIDKGNFGAAADVFTNIYQFTGESRHLWNLALVEYKANRTLPALKHMQEYLAKPDANPKNLELARKLIDELSQKVGHLVITAPSGAQISVDGVAVGRAPLALPIDVDPSTAHVVVAGDGTHEAKRDVTPTGTNEVRVDLAFPPPPAAPIVVSPSSLSAQPHDSAQKHPAPLRLWLTVGLGVGAVALAAGGVYMGIQSSYAAADAQRIKGGQPPGACKDPSYPGCGDLNSAISTSNSDHTASMLLYGGAGILAAGAIASWFFLPRERDAVSARAVPLVGPNTLGAGWTGSF